MPRFSDTLKNYLSEFFVREIGGNEVYGMTYAFVMKEPNNPVEKKKYDNYMLIRNEANACGYSKNEVFRVYEVSNGYIFDMDLGIAKKISQEILLGVVREKKLEGFNIDTIGDKPLKRRKKDMVALSKFLLQQLKQEGKSQVEIALFSKNVTNRIMVTGVLENGDKVCVKYNAYALRHADIETLNEQLLIPQGIRVAAMQPCEILPYKNGVSFIFKLEKIKV